MNQIITRPDDLNRTRAFSPMFVIVAGMFVTCLLLSNIVAGRLIDFFGMTLTGAVVLFPITYIFGDVLTEVWGFKRSRLIIWLGFAANILMVLIFVIISNLPAPGYFDPTAYQVVMAVTPIVVVASMIGYLSGEFCNSTVLSVMKKYTKGNRLWMRTIGSTIVGEGVDTVFFIGIVFLVGFQMPLEVVLGMMALQYAVKVTYEVLATPLTYKVVGYIKKKESVDVYDYGVTYNPFEVDT
jgi:uncharacterized integral membrane protein (TIGR00697 family)